MKLKDWRYALYGAGSAAIVMYFPTLAACLVCLILMFALLECIR